MSDYVISIKDSTPDSRDLIMPHQKDAVDAMSAYFNLKENYGERSGLVVMPTGSGKTFTAVNWLLTEGIVNGYKIVWLVHRQELVEQTYREFRRQAPILKGTGINKLKIYPISGARDKGHIGMSSAVGADIYVCSTASVASRNGFRFISRILGKAGREKLIIVCDESHHAVAGGCAKVLNRMTALNPNRVLLGLTATPYRMQDSEQRQLNKMFNIDTNIGRKIGRHGYVYEITLKELIKSGFLADPRYKRVSTNIIGEVEYDITPEDEAFFEKHHEASESLKNQIARSSARNKVILDNYLENRNEYGKTLIFAVNQMHAETLCNEFKKAGVNCDYAVSSRRDALDVIDRFKANEFDVLINVQMMTEGSDVPDIKTVMLTRETNSDSLLMQMIGRALRGERAHGTKTANIISFYDKWETFARWLDPGELDMFNPVDEEEYDDMPETEEPLPEISYDEEALIEMLCREQPNMIEDIEDTSISSRDLYLKLYNLMKVSLSSSEDKLIIPCGWYSLPDEDGYEMQILVYDGQLEAYREIEANVANFAGKISIDLFKRLYFGNIVPIPDDSEIICLLDYIDETGTMPPYFTFEERDRIRPDIIAREMVKLSDKEEVREAFLKKLFDASPVIRNIYKTFFAFKKTIFDEIKDKTEEKIVTTDADDIKDYTITENAYNLQELFDELKSEYPLLRFDHVVKVGWSEAVVVKWLGFCQPIIVNDNLFFQITVNKLVSSSNLENGREVVKYLLFHEMLHANGYWDHNRDFRDREWQYPDSAELDGILDSLCLEHKIQNVKKFVFNENPDKEEAVKNAINILERQKISAEFNLDAAGIEEGFKYCMNCGTKMPDYAVFCPKCGFKQ